MKLPFAMFFLVIVVVGSSAQTAPIDTFRVSETVRLRGTDEEHQAKLVVTTADFSAARHRITHRNLPIKGRGATNVPVSSTTLIDGRPPLGANGGIPSTEIRSMFVTFDGLRIEVPARFYSDCYNPNFQKDYWGTKLSDDGNSLLIFMAGGQGKGLYQVIWILRKDRQHARFFNNCPECDHKDILNFFKEK
ncbi:MAG: hypothetical protein QOF62_2904 [Pyrinomonadaceae bacterium]|nr:hypothetical protein [Pyrinomonadaceae bacterium]